MQELAYQCHEAGMSRVGAEAVLAYVHLSEVVKCWRAACAEALEAQRRGLEAMRRARSRPHVVPECPTNATPEERRAHRARVRLIRLAYVDGQVRLAKASARLATAQAEAVAWEQCFEEAYSEWGPCMRHLNGADTLWRPGYREADRAVLGPEGELLRLRSPREQRMIVEGGYIRW